MNYTPLVSTFSSMFAIVNFCMVEGKLARRIPDICSLRKSLSQQTNQKQHLLRVHFLSYTFSLQVKLLILMLTALSGLFGTLLKLCKEYYSIIIWKDVIISTLNLRCNDDKVISKSNSRCISKCSTSETGFSMEALCDYIFREKWHLVVIWSQLFLPMLWLPTLFYSMLPSVWEVWERCHQVYICFPLFLPMVLRPLFTIIQ